MDVRELAPADVADVVELWTQAGLTRPWNDPERDYLRSLAGSTSSVLGVRHGQSLVGTVMVGHDGHRGWVYYLAVSPTRGERGSAPSS